MYQYRATIVRVIDADTVVADIDVGFNITHRVTCRLLGVNAPEMSTAAGVAARSAVVSLIQGRTLDVRTVKDRGDKYGRILMTVMIDDSTSLNDWLVKQGYAVPYMT